MRALSKKLGMWEGGEGLEDGGGEGGGEMGRGRENLYLVVPNCNSSYLGD